MPCAQADRKSAEIAILVVTHDTQLAGRMDRVLTRVKGWEEE